MLYHSRIEIKKSKFWSIHTYRFVVSSSPIFLKEISQPYFFLTVTAHLTAFSLHLIKKITPLTREKSKMNNRQIFVLKTKWRYKVHIKQYLFLRNRFVYCCLWLLMFLVLFVLYYSQNIRTKPQPAPRYRYRDFVAGSLFETCYQTEMLFLQNM